ncbi:ABC transporter permease [Oceanispirochaeta crateris]|uniref:ABC transporter permease n=1 Tax=Oceanispirochaeta crateris TaxID=2518645 RepID=A0A5C1QLU6_9SPIO|nr:ABC transporter permease [Oceanispirochaeta crateris]QEN09043.1 ABC transporter permease [Oceanispirochaeta crateris]
MFKLAFQSLINRKNVLILIYISLTLSVLLFLGVQRVKDISKNSFSRTISGTDLIIGARTGQVNLILYSVFHIGNAVNNMGYDSYLDLTQHDDVAWSVPLSLGDSHKGFRVVGTTVDYFYYYTYGKKTPLEFAEGEEFKDLFSVVLGAAVAHDLGYEIGDSIVVNHGAGTVTLSSHDNMPFYVSGILEPTGTPVDKSLFIPLEGISAIHIGWETGVQARNVTKEQALRVDLTPKSITAALVGLQNRGSAFRYQREVNNYSKEPLLAILPGAALYELWSLMGVAEKALTFLSGAVVLIGLISLLSAQLAVLNQRRREMALLRSLGATPGRIFFMLFMESTIMTAAGCLSGLGLLYLLQIVTFRLFRTSGFYLDLTAPSSREWFLLAITLVAGILTGLIPAIATYKKSLSDGMSIRS